MVNLTHTAEMAEKFGELYVDSGFKREHVQYTAEVLLPDITRFLLNETDKLSESVGTLLVDIGQSMIVLTALCNGLEIDKLVQLGDTVTWVSPIKFPTPEKLKEIVTDLRQKCEAHDCPCVYEDMDNTWRSALVAGGMTISTIRSVTNYDMEHCMLILSDILKTLHYGIKDANS